MSFGNILKSTFIISFGAVVGYSSVKYLSRPNENNRGLASMTFSKLGTEQYAKTLFDIKIINESLAKNSDEESSLLVTIEAYKSLPTGLEYTWNLPDTVTLIQGQLTGTVDNFSARETKEFRIKVKGYSKEVRNYVSFTLKGHLENKQIERDVLVSSRPEDSFEYVVQEREKERAIVKKTFNKLGQPEAKSPIDIDKVSF